MRRHRVLCIEDDPTIADLLVEVLSDGNFEVVVASDGPEGLTRLSEGIDVVVCDIDLPGFDGLEILRRARRAPAADALVPFIFLTAFGQRENQIEARRLGCDDFITKPIDFELLLAVLGNVLQRVSAPVPDTASGVGTAARLTERELEVITWVSRGKSSVDIASIIGIAERTVNFHIDKTMRKLGVTTRMQAAVACVQLGLLKP